MSFHHLKLCWNVNWTFAYPVKSIGWTLVNSHTIGVPFWSTFPGAASEFIIIKPLLAVVLLNTSRDAGKVVTHWDCILVLLVQFQSSGGKLVLVNDQVVGSEQSSDHKGAGWVDEDELLFTTELDLGATSIL